MKATVLRGHALDVLRTLPDNSVHCVNTSSPYYGLRSYGTEPVVWAAPDGAPLCEHGWHEWALTPLRRTRTANDAPNSPKQLTSAGTQHDLLPTDTCSRCNAWRGELGQEPTPQLFIAHLVSVFREVRRVLRNDGVCFANIADSWGGSWGNYGGRNLGNGKQRTKNNGSLINYAAYDNMEQTVPPMARLQPKSAMLIPERFVIALQDDGWIVRMPIVWAKGISFLPNYAGSVMPESVTDRPTKSYEMIYMLAKSARYYWDKWAVAEPISSDMKLRASLGHTRGGNGKVAPDRNDGDTLRGEDAKVISESNRNLRSVWAINPEPSSLRHYAMQPSKIAETVIRAGTSERGVCSTCGAPWVRVTKRTQVGERDDTGRTHSTTEQRMGKTPPPEKGWESTTETVGWRPTCACNAGEPVPSVILDPFSGAGTTGVVAARLGRDYIGIELNDDYASMSEQRIAATPYQAELML